VGLGEIPQYARQVVITGIVVALPEELGTLTRKKIAPGCSAFIAETIIVALSGAGAENARCAAQRLVAQGATRLLSWGCAGALTGTLKPGDLCLPETLRAVDKRQFTTDDAWRRQLCAAWADRFSINTGALVESARIVSSGAEKATLHQRQAAQLVDMESCACAAVAAQAGVPFLAVKAIADPADMDLPAAVSYAMRKNGQVAFGKLLLYVLKHPHEIAGLIKLGRHFQAAKDTLTTAGKQLMPLI
jgi:adenosylhomocysteine nucleosidase